MKERPIIFSGEMVRAILEGRKTQTRRVIKPEWYRCLDLEEPEDVAKALAQCPYGQPGDRLWVKETWTGDEWTGLAYKASEPDALPFGEEAVYDKWRPSIFMPRWASRITLEITERRIERLQDITFGDLTKEGVTKTDPMSHPSHKYDLLQDYINLWNSINAKRGYPWEDNDWVWVITFKVIA